MNRADLDLFYDGESVEIVDRERVPLMSWAVGISDRGILEHPADMPNRCDHQIFLLQPCERCEP